jgi:hypothetical protein
MDDVGTLSDLSTPWCVHVVATLRVADHIAAGITDIAGLASICGAHADSLARVLQHLVSRGLFEQPSRGRFVLNAPARALLEPSARLGLDLDGIGGRMAQAWSTLLTAVRTGTPAYSDMFGLPFWEDLQAHPEIRASFDALMGPEGHGTPDAEVLPGGDWEAVRTVVDVGGGTGSLLAEILKAHPHVQGTLVDLPATIVRSEEIFRSAGVNDRVRAVAQSFFDPLPHGADLYLLKNILADWPDREATTILTRCAEAALPAGRIVLLSGISPDDDDGPPPELLMMVLVGGKQRTFTEFGALARAAGLNVHRTRRQNSGRLIVECRPAEGT